MQTNEADKPRRPASRRWLLIGALAALAAVPASYAISDYLSRAAFGAVPRPADWLGDRTAAAARFAEAGPALERLRRLADARPLAPMFDGRTLDGWRGDPRLWSVEDGEIVGRLTGEIDDNSFLVWQQDAGDFVLELEFRIDPAAANNSGVQYRSRLVPDRPFRLTGMQADLHLATEPKYRLNFGGMLYDELGGREIIALPGQRLHVDERGARIPLDELATVASLAANRRETDWNRLRIIACGRRLVHEINGRPVVDVIDDHPDWRGHGLIGLQVHSGKPHEVRFRRLGIDRAFGSVAGCGRWQ